MTGRSSHGNYHAYGYSAETDLKPRSCEVHACFSFLDEVLSTLASKPRTRPDCDANRGQGLHWSSLAKSEEGLRGIDACSAILSVIGKATHHSPERCSIRDERASRAFHRLSTYRMLRLSGSSQTELAWVKPPAKSRGGPEVLDDGIFAFQLPGALLKPLHATQVRETLTKQAQLLSQDVHDSVSQALYFEPAASPLLHWTPAIFMKSWSRVMHRWLELCFAQRSLQMMHLRAAACRGNTAKQYCAWTRTAHTEYLFIPDLAIQPKPGIDAFARFYWPGKGHARVGSWS